MPRESAESQVMHELELGEHTLVIYSDQSSQLIDFSGDSYHAENVMSLSSEETYRLFVSLREVFQPQQ